MSSAPGSAPRRRGRRAALGAVGLAVAGLLLSACASDGGGSSAAPGTSAAPRPADAAAPAPGASTPGAPAPGDPAPGTPATPPAVPTPDGETLLVADFGGKTVTFVDPVRGGVGSVEVGTAPYGIALGSDGRAWVATAEGVAIVDTKQRALLGRVPYTAHTGRPTYGEYRGGGMGIAISPDGLRVYVGVNIPGKDGVLQVVDTATRAVVGSVPTGRRPFDVVVARDGSEAYSVDHDAYTVTAVRADTLSARRMTVAPYGTKGGLGGWLKPHYAEVRADGRLVLPFEGERLAVLDPRTGDVAVERMTASTHQHGTALTPDGRLLVVGTGSDGTVHGPASLTVRDPAGGERVIRLQGAHEDVTSSRDGKTAYVTGGFTRDGSWDGITVVDLTSGDTRRLPVGDRPLGVVVLP